MIGVIGSSNMDIVLTVEHFTNPGETQKAKELEYFPGGKGANQAVAAAKLSNKEVYFFILKSKLFTSSFKSSPPFSLYISL